MQVAFFAPPAAPGPAPVPASPAGDAAAATFDAFLTASAAIAAPSEPAATPPGAPPPAEDCADSAPTLDAWLAANAAPALPPVVVPPLSMPDESAVGDPADAADPESAETTESESAGSSDAAEFGVAAPARGRSKAAPPAGRQPSHEVHDVPVVTPFAAGEAGVSVPAPEPGRATEREVATSRCAEVTTAKAPRDTERAGAAVSGEPGQMRFPAAPVIASAAPSAGVRAPLASPGLGDTPSVAPDSDDARVETTPAGTLAEPGLPLPAVRARSEVPPHAVPHRGPDLAMHGAPVADIPGQVPVAELSHDAAAALPAATSSHDPLSLVAAPATAASVRPESPASPVRESLGRTAHYSAASPGLQVAVTTHELAGVAAAREPVAAPVFAPAVAAPTLAQVLVETGAGRSPVSSKVSDTGSSSSPVLSAFTSAGAAEATARPLTAPVATIAGAAAEQTPVKAFPTAGGEGVRPTETAPTTTRPAPEKLAGARGKSAGAAAEPAESSSQRNFLTVDKQMVGDQSSRSGTTIAEGGENMPAHSTASAPASAALDLVDAPAVTPLAAAKDLTGAAVRLPHSTHSAGTAAAAAVQETLALAERTQEAGRNHVELRVQTAGDEHLRVHLRWHDGVIETRFVTETADLQQALSREWARVVPQLADKGLRFGEATFERRDQQPSDQSSAQNAFTFDQQQHSSRGQKQAFAGPEDAASALPLTTLRGRNPAVRGVQPTATTSHPQPPPTAAAVRNLRAWA